MSDQSSELAHVSAMSAWSLRAQTRDLVRSHGISKPMAPAGEERTEPYFLLRQFLGEVDMLTIFKTARCRYQCDFCNLPSRSAHGAITASDVVDQFVHALRECRSALSVVDRLTISNDGSVLDGMTFPRRALMAIVESTQELPQLGRVVLETRAEFIAEPLLAGLARENPGVRLDMLVGFETLDESIRSEVLGKRFKLETFLGALDILAACGADLTAYVLYKPDLTSSRESACDEACRTIDFLAAETERRNLNLTVRLNPTYVATGSRLESRLSTRSGVVQPVDLRDVLRLARSYREEGLRLYIGLSSEGLAGGGGDYRSHPEFKSDLIREALAFNAGRPV